MSKWMSIVVAVLVGSILFGCGSDGNAAAIQRLDALCRASNGKAASEILRLYDDPRVKAAASERQAIALEVDLFSPILLADAEAQMRAIRKFEIASGREDQVHAILVAYSDWIEHAKRNPRSAVIANDVYNHARALAGSYGLVSCGMSPFAAKVTAGAPKPPGPVNLPSRVIE